jgi:hypothetical protein
VLLRFELLPSRIWQLNEKSLPHQLGVHPFAALVMDEKLPRDLDVIGFDLNRAYITLIRAYISLIAQGKLQPAQDSEIDEKAL